MKIVSRFPYVWPHLGFGLVEGVNDVEESRIPLAAHAKLLHLSKPGRDESGTELPAPISGYEPSKQLSDAAEKHFSRQSRVKPPVATLETLSSTPAPNAEAPKAEAVDRSGQHPNPPKRG